VKRVVKALLDFASLIRGASREQFAGIIDFSYQHYALGDLLTSQVNLACLAIEHGCRGLDLYVIVDPAAPAAPQQTFITPENYLTHLDNVFPALLVSPMLRSIRLIRDPLTAGLSLLTLVASRVPTWPPLSAHLRRRMTYPLGHGIINRFHGRHGYVPKLEAPRGYAGWARRFIAQHYAGRFLVCINPRQSRLTPTPAVTQRDAPLEEWYDFLRTVGRRYPDVHFFMLGGFLEWEHTLLKVDNVSIPRTMGLTLAHELALLTASNLFMGTSSGFATMATFSGVPYVITSIEPFFARSAGVEPNAMRYPFAGVHQHLVWQREDARLLLHHFQRVYHASTEVPS
jgi:hypothetical protein